jgi:hypothetical protein
MNAQVSGLPEALARLRSLHAALSPEDRESQMEEDQLASELHGLLTLAEAPVPLAAAASSGGQQQAAEEESDHVPLDMTESNVRNGAGAGAGRKASAGPSSATASGSSSAAPAAFSGGAMVACPKVDMQLA